MKILINKQRKKFSFLIKIFYKKIILSKFIKIFINRKNFIKKTMKKKIEINILLFINNMKFKLNQT